jgi:transcription termination factor Rho
MSVLDRAALQDSPLADLHELGSELSIDGFRRLRRADLIDAILAKQDGREVDGAAVAQSSGEASAKGASKEAAGEAPSGEASDDEASDDEPSDEPSQSRRRRGRRGGRGRGAASSSREEDSTEDVAEPEPERAKEPESDGPEEDQMVEGVVELLGNGSGFVRVDPPDPSDDDVYISAAQVKRCELVSGDRIAGPRRRPRRSERFASLIRIDTINDRPASELADSTRFDELPIAFPSERFELPSEDATVKAIAWLTPFGRGSRVSIVGPARSGKSEALRRLAGALSETEGIELSIVLAGVRPEEIPEWTTGSKQPATAVALGASPEALGTAIEAAVDQARRLAARGADVVVLIDTLDGAPAPAARKAMASARNIVDGGSLTVVATSTAPVGGETTVIALDQGLTATSRFPALDLVASGTMRPELLVGQAGADAIATARIEAGQG